jgi:single-strand DNA-binding protein
MPYLNSVTLMGYLTADPELRHLASGDAVASLRIAVSYTRSEDKTRKSEFFDCDLWGGWATNLTKTAKKGALVVVDGRLAEDRWVDAKTNQSRSRVKIVARRAFHVVPQYAEPRDAEEQGAGEVRSTAASGEAPAPSPWD